MTKEIYKKLIADFKKEAVSEDNSRGFRLTSIKAQYIAERLNEVFGFDGWRHVCNSHEIIGGEVIVHATLYAGNAERSQFGGATLKKDKKNGVGDAFKGAMTDSLSKCSSLIGVANEVFKGNVDPTKVDDSKPDKTRNKPKTNKPTKEMEPVVI